MVSGVQRRQTNVHDKKRSGCVNKQFEWQIFEHPPYSPDLAPSNHHLCPLYLKKFFAVYSLRSDQETKDLCRTG